MNEFEEWSMQQLNKGISIGKKEERSRNIKNIAKYLISQSKQEGKDLSEKEALKQAEALIS